MKLVSLSGSPRENVGKKDAAELRNNDLVPAVIYGGKEQTHFAIKRNDARKLVFTPNVYQVEVDVNGKKVKTVIKEVQFHPISDEIIHMDFQETLPGKAVKLKLPVRLTGSSVGVRAGGKLSQVFRKLTVVGEADNLPEEIVIDITNLKVGQDVRVSSISFPGVKILDPANAVVCAVKRGRVAIAQTDEEETEAAAEAPAEA
jgi:large subunit ribosomal protein L25